MITIKHDHYPAAYQGDKDRNHYFAQLFEGEEPKFDTVKEDKEQLRYAAGEGYAPHPPHKNYGPGGHRFLVNEDLDRPVWSYESQEEVLQKIASKDAIRGAQNRVKKLRKKLELAEKRLKAMLDVANQRIFDAKTWTEIKP